MVQVAVGLDEFGGLVCTLTDGATRGTVRASNPGEAAADLLGALDNALVNGTGECFWTRESGQYRWLIRRNQDTAQLVVLWSAGTLTGWENAFWTECEWEPLQIAIRTEIERYFLTGAQRAVEKYASF